MKALYLESSALLAWLFGEPGSDKVAQAVEAAEIVVTSSLTFAEAERAITRALGERLLREADARRARGTLRRARGGWMVMAVSEAVLERSGRAFPVEPMRTLDAIHLATALAFTEAFADLEVLTLDRRIDRNAKALGLSR